MTVANILVPTDRSPAAERAFIPAAKLAVRNGSTVTIIQVTHDPLAPVPGRVARTDGPHIGDEAFDLVPVINIEVEASDVVAAIVEQAVRTQADLIVMGTHGHSGFTRLRLGSVAEAVTRLAPCPVLLVCEGAGLEGWRLTRVLVAVDPVDLQSTGHGPSTLSPPIRRAADLAASSGAHLNLVSVVEGSPERGYPSLRRCAAGLLALTVQLSRARPAIASVDYTVRQGDAAEAVATHALRTGADLVVVGRQRNGLGRLALGSVAAGVSRQAPCPVLVVSPDATPPHTPATFRATALEPTALP